MAALEGWGDLEDTLVVTATEGLTSMTHLMGSLLLLEARKRGARTLCLQHGMVITKTFTPASAIVGAWDEDTAKALSVLMTQDAAFEIKCIGSPKFLDALMPPSSSALRNRLGEFASDYRRIVLIGLNLHWRVHIHKPSETYRWIDRMSRKNPESLFVLRPHPDDGTSYEALALLERPNVVLVDEMLLLSLDWPLARLVRAVDGVITTYSTLAIDAAAAGKPVALLPSEVAARDPSSFLPVSVPWSGGAAAIPRLSEQDWSSGKLPECLERSPSGNNDVISNWFTPSWTSLVRLAESGRGARLGGREAALRAVAQALMAAAREHCLDINPHHDRNQLHEAICRFVGT
jgi:hypothetical protein